MADRFPGHPGVVCSSDLPRDLPEDQFFSLVASADQHDWNPDDEPPDLDERPDGLGPCPECGETRACAYDAEGRPMIHTTAEDADA